MIILIIGGSASGKSAYGESLACNLSINPIYLATMQTKGHAAKERIAKHRAQRAGKGFDTMECERTAQIESADVKNRTVLLEDLPNLVANEVFLDSVDCDWAGAKRRITSAIVSLADTASNLIIITGDLASEGKLYDEVTTGYLRLLGQLQQEIAKMADRVYEVVAGIPTPLKGENR